MSNKKNKQKQDRKQQKKQQWNPVLQRINQTTTREQWRDQAPRLTEDQKARLQEIIREVYYQRKFTPERNNFMRIHELIEDEISHKTREEFGLITAIEWNGKFSDNNAREFKKIGGKDHVEGILPTFDFLNSELYDYIEVFHPVAVLFTFEDYDLYMKNSEQSIKEAERRRESGDAYMTDRDAAISYRPEGDTV